MSIAQKHIYMGNVSPIIEDGNYAVKAIINDTIKVESDIFRDGHELISAAVIWRPLKKTEYPESSLNFTQPELTDLEKYNWNQSLLQEKENDRWMGEIKFNKTGWWIYSVIAWSNRFLSWHDELCKKVNAGLSVSSELLEGEIIIKNYYELATGKQADKLDKIIKSLETGKNEYEKITLLQRQDIVKIIADNNPRTDCVILNKYIPIWVDRVRARYSSWYEIFVRSQKISVNDTVDLENNSQANKSNKIHSDFKEAEKRLPLIAALGFNVLYLTPIHPIGHTNRKGPNNTEGAKPNDPGCPWAIGSHEGGHKAIHPELGTIEDFDNFQKKAKQYGLEIALDFAIQCSPDHPWVKKHPAWFSHRPDGTIKYAENPPKKYQDVYPVNFDTTELESLYKSLLDIMLFWIKHNVKIFRVDNPHTKPFTFWQWLINKVHKNHPDVIFLSEAFTRPKRMYNLAKLGFSQSYTYFTWRNTKQELSSYAHELFCTDVHTFFRPNFFTNTPDILHAYLQEGGRPAFIIRLILAATMSPSYGIYNGFELCENIAVKPGSEEYLDSEKYQYKLWDWDRSGHIKDIIILVNKIREENTALQFLSNLQIIESTNDNIIAYLKVSKDKTNILLIIVNLDPFAPQEGTVCVPPEYTSGSHNYYQVTDLLTNTTYTWSESWNYVRLDPRVLPAHILSFKQ